MAVSARSHSGDCYPRAGWRPQTPNPAAWTRRCGGAQTIYLYVVAREVIYILATYAKNEQTDLTPDDKKVLRALIERIKRGRG